jgi:hypothetical protein
MKKIIGLVVLCAVVGAGFWLYMNLGGFAKNKTEEVASQALGVPVKISDFKIHLKEKEIIISGLEIANPKGFDTARLMKVETAKIAASSLSDKTLVFNEIVIDGTDINLEVRETGTNFSALQKSVQAQRERKAAKILDKADTGNAETADEYKVVIKRLLINNAKLTPTSKFIESDLDTFIMPDISISSIGAKEGGIPASEAIAIVTAELSDAVLKTALKSGYLDGLPNDVLTNLKYKYDATGAIVDKVTSDFKKAGEELKGLLGGGSR